MLTRRDFIKLINCQDQEHIERPALNRPLTRPALANKSNLTIFILAMSLLLAACTSAFGSVPQEDPLIGTKALLESLNGHEPLKYTKITAEFVQVEYGLRAIGSTGCNQYELPYQQHGNLLAISKEADPAKQGVVTQLLCVEPEGAMEQEQEYLNALRAVASFQTIADRLEMQNQAGQTILVFKKWNREATGMVSQSQLCFARLLVSPSLRGKTQARFSTFDDKKHVIIPAP